MNIPPPGASLASLDLLRPPRVGGGEMKGRTLMPAPTRIVLVTGASRGIGRAAAVALAKDGAHVVLVARTVGGLEEADDEVRKAGGSATLVPLDLKDFAAIDRLGASLFERWGRLDGLFANAGALGVLTPLAHLDPKVWQDALDVNVTANWRLIRSLDPLLKKSQAGRALFVSSGAARNFRPYWVAYGVTKAALEAIGAQLPSLLGRLWRHQGGAGSHRAHLRGRMR